MPFLTAIQYDEFGSRTPGVPGSVNGPSKRFVHDANAKGLGTVRNRWLLPDDAIARRSPRNEPPAWLANAHRSKARLAIRAWFKLHYLYPPNIHPKKGSRHMLPISRRELLARVGTGLGTLGLAAMLDQQGLARRQSAGAEEAAVSAKSQARHPPVHEWRAEPGRYLRSEAGAGEVSTGRSRRRLNSRPNAAPAA